VTAGTLQSLLLIGVIATVAPLIAELGRRIRLPAVVVEICLGILVGPAVLGLAHPDSVINALSDLGLAFLMFLAGYEIDLARIKGDPLRRATAGWLLSVVLALIIAFGLVSTGFALDTLVIGMTLTTTALGTILPMLHDAGVVETEFGRHILAIGTLGEFGPIVAIAVLLTGKDPLVTVALLVLFLVIAVATALLAMQAHPPAFVSLLRRHLRTSAQLPVRVAVLMILVLVFIAFRLGLDVLLGAFAAGVAVRLFAVGEDSEIIRGKLEAIGFGWLVPIFFIVSGMKFDLHAFIARPATLLRVPLFLALFLIVRGTPALLLYRSRMPLRDRIPLALFSATGLPLIVVITTLGVATGRMFPDNAAALVGAGLLSVLIFPVVGLTRLGSGRTNNRVLHASAPGASEGTRSVVGPDATAQANPDDG
jgi:Kef-type K+ transport system membrane component KefB